MYAVEEEVLVFQFSFGILEYSLSKIKKNCSL